MCIYRYGWYGKLFDNFLNEFASLLTQLVLSCDSYIICGDFNIHWNKPTESETIKLMDILSEFGLVCCNPITPTQKCGNTIDLVLCNSSLCNKLTTITVENHYQLGDHYPLFFSLKTNTNGRNTNNSIISFRNFRKVNMESFTSDVLNSLSNISDSCQSFKPAINYYNNAILNCSNKHAPLTTRKVP